MQNSYQRRIGLIGGLAFMAIAIMTWSFRPEHSFRQFKRQSGQ
jgi:hypothetical protein